VTSSRRPIRLVGFKGSAITAMRPHAHGRRCDGVQWGRRAGTGRLVPARRAARRRGTSTLQPRSTTGTGRTGGSPSATSSPCVFVASAPLELPHALTGGARVSSSLTMSSLSDATRQIPSTSTKSAPQTEKPMTSTVHPRTRVQAIAQADQPSYGGLAVSNTICGNGITFCDGSQWVRR
jgi:hypothetical protein